MRNAGAAKPARVVRNVMMVEERAGSCPDKANQPSANEEKATSNYPIKIGGIKSD